MTNCNKFGRALRTTAAVVAVALVTLTGCTQVDDTLGANMIPGSQELKAGFRSLSGVDKYGKLNPRRYFETRLYLTDSIASSNRVSGTSTYVYFGATKSDTMGLREAGFLSQFTPYSEIDSGYFGYRPIFDSIQLMFSISDWMGDTLETQTFNVYEVVDNKYVTDSKDTIFYTTFDPEKRGIISTEPIFTFTFPNGGGSAPTTASSVTMTPTAAGNEFISRMMLQSGKYKNDYSIYKNANIKKWVEEFKGFYIRPASNITRGAVFATSLDAAGIALFGRNRLKDDPSLIKDTIQLAYFFYDSYATAGNVSINTVKHDYSRASSSLRINPDDAKETNLNRPLNGHIMVEGQGGVVTEITFSQEFFDELEDICRTESNEDKITYKTFAVNQANLKLFFSQSNYDWTLISDITNLASYMNASLPRLGLYTNYKKLTGIVDYNYYYELAYGTELAYGGEINRSQGCYEMNISSYIQGLWNDYQKEKALSPDGKVDLSKIKNRVIYLGPEAYGLFSGEHTVLQGMNDGINHVSIKLDLTYTMVK